MPEVTKVDFSQNISAACTWRRTMTTGRTVGTAWPSSPIALVHNGYTLLTVPLTIHNLRTLLPPLPSLSAPFPPPRDIDPNDSLNIRNNQIRTECVLSMTQCFPLLSTTALYSDSTYGTVSYPFYFAH